METVVRRPGESETLQVGPSTAELKAVKETTGGAFSISETTIAPGFTGPPPHIHRQIYDSFYVLEGTLTLTIGEEQTEVGPGTFAGVAPGTVHTFSNRSDQAVRFLNINAPGGWEAYLRELAEAMSSGEPPDPAAMAEIASKYDFEPAS